MIQRPYFLICPYLKVYKDMGTDENGNWVDTGISNAECLKYEKGEPCTDRGKCILAREYESWKIVTKKSWKGKGK